MIATVLAVGLALIAGIRSVAWTDAFQALIMLVASVGVVWVLARGWGALRACFPPWSAITPNG